MIDPHIAAHWTVDLSPLNKHCKRETHNAELPFHLTFFCLVSFLTQKSFSLPQARWPLQSKNFLHPNQPQRFMVRASEPSCKQCSTLPVRGIISSFSVTLPSLQMDSWTPQGFWGFQTHHCQRQSWGCWNLCSWATNVPSYRLVEKESLLLPSTKTLDIVYAFE